MVVYRIGPCVHWSFELYMLALVAAIVGNSLSFYTAFFLLQLYIYIYHIERVCLETLQYSYCMSPIEHVWHIKMKRYNNHRLWRTWVILKSYAGKTTVSGIVSTKIVFWGKKKG